LERTSADKSLGFNKASSQNRSTGELDEVGPARALCQAPATSPVALLRLGCPSGCAAPAPGPAGRILPYEGLGYRARSGSAPVRGSTWSTDFAARQWNQVFRLPAVNQPGSFGEGGSTSKHRINWRRRIGRDGGFGYRARSGAVMWGQPFRGCRRPSGRRSRWPGATARLYRLAC